MGSMRGSNPSPRPRASTPSVYSFNRSVSPSRARPTTYRSSAVDRSAPRKAVLPSTRSSCSSTDSRVTNELCIRGAQAVLKVGRPSPRSGTALESNVAAARPPYRNGTRRSRTVRVRSGTSTGRRSRRRVVAHDRREVTVRTSPAVLVVTGAIVAVLAGCVTPATRSSGQLSSHAVNIPSEPANGIRVRGRCDIAPGRSGMASHALIVRVDMGRCHLTHLGAVRVEVENQFNLVLGTQSTQLMLTTADGAQVRMSVVGDSDGR